MTNEDDGRRTEGNLSGLGALAPALAGLALLGGALAYYMGWRYERAYVEEWGLPFSAFSYSPQELMLANEFTALFAGTLPLALLALLFRDVTTADPPPKVEQNKVLIVRGIAGAGGTLTAMAIVLAQLFPEESTVIVGTVFIAELLLLGSASILIVMGVQISVPLLVVMMVFAFILIAFTPQALGRGAAITDRNNLDRLPRADLIARDPQQLDVSGSWHIIRQNDGILWLAREVAGELDVAQVDLDLVLRVNYLESN